MLWWLFTLEPSALSAQTGTPEPIVDAIWPQLENRLDQPDADSTLSTALAQVRDRCDGEYDCLHRCYKELTYRAWNVGSSWCPPSGCVRKS